MKKNSFYLVITLLVLISCNQKNETVTVPTQAQAVPEADFFADRVLSTPITPEVVVMGNKIDAKAMGIAAFEWGYALVRMEKTMRDYTTVPNPLPATSYRAPLNHIGWAKRLPTADDADMPTANNDTYYMSAVVDLKEPYILFTPELHDRYFVVDMFDMYQNLVDYVGRRTTGTAAAAYAIVPAGWHGKLPKGIKKTITISTSKVWLWGRLKSIEGEAPEQLSQIQESFKLYPLSQYGKLNPVAPTGTLEPMPTSNTDSLIFFKKLAFALKTNPVPATDSGLFGQFERIGLTKGEFNELKLSASQKTGLIEALTEAPLAITASVQFASVMNNGWTYASGLDNFGYNYPFRSLVAGPYLGGQGEKEAVYPIRYTDDKGDFLTGAKKYKLHFLSEPPVNAFWSVTMYDAKTKLLVHNPINRFAISSDNTKLQKNSDGSFDLLLQTSKPTNESMAGNWLPCANENFYIILRMYQPKESVLNNTYKFPILSVY